MDKHYWLLHTNYTGNLAYMYVGSHPMIEK